MHQVVPAPTNDRSVLGILVNFARAIPVHLPIRGWNPSSLLEVEDLLAENPCHAGKRWEGVIWAKSKAPELLSAAGGAAP